jgi:hypothetical protein
MLKGSEKPDTPISGGASMPMSGSVAPEPVLALRVGGPRFRLEPRTLEVRHAHSGRITSAGSLSVSLK